MKIKKLISSALLVVLMFSFVVALVPTGASAAYIETSEGSAKLSEKEIEEYIVSIYDRNSETRYKFETAEEMLNYERELGYLNSVTTSDKTYTIYVNKYTGVLYYANNVTGQILTSNPYNYSTTDADLVNQLLLSQINIKFTEIATNKSTEDFSSAYEAALRGQISSSFIKNGIRVNYTLGDTTARFLLPGRMKADKFEEQILKPMLENFGNLMNEYCKDIDYDKACPEVKALLDTYSEKGFGFYEYEGFYKYDKRKIELNTKTFYNSVEYGYLNQFAYMSYFDQMKTLFSYDRNDNPDGFSKTDKDLERRARYNELNQLLTDFLQLTNWMTLVNPSSYFDKENYTESKAYQKIIREYYTPSDSNRDCEIFETLDAMYVYTRGNDVALKSEASLLFQKYANDYTFSEMFEDEDECGYIDQSLKKPVFRLSLEYTFNSDGSLNVRLPANSISFDETLYNLDKITPLEVFGVGDIKNNDGYIFYPDGSGTLLNFDDLRSMKIRANLASAVYGRDQSYSNIEIVSPPHAQISMPVYGVVAEEKATEFTSTKYSIDTVTNGYFAMLEEGASLAQIGFQTGGSEHPFGGAYCFYQPYPSDKFALDSASVGVSSEYTIVSESKYTGSYVTRIVMLADERLNPTDKFYDASYVGMASYYRNRLEETGVITALENTDKNLPLYIEALGSMEIITKFLSFPITTKVALTTFDDVLTMYNEIADVEKINASFDSMIEKYKELAENARATSLDMEDETLAAKYLRQAESYDELVAKYTELKGKVASIDNVNFRLTGFGNGGLYYTYPTKVRWDSACGGKKAFNNLVSKAEELSVGAKNLGIYPEYDFLYINYTDLFDGISVRGNVSRMVDNRYASKQVYDSVMHEYVSNFTLVINPEALERLYAKFISQYTKYNVKGISVSTLGSDLNSNFDEDVPVNRDDAEKYVVSVLDKLKNGESEESKKYDVMLDVGNVYSVEYASHILNASIDSSHFRFASSPIPFVGMILHGYVNYAGTPFNYSGAPEYDMLRSIESGAAAYYILCYQNSGYMKDDIELNDYYGIDYSTWYDDMVITHTELSNAIGDLQNYKIVDHKFIIGERVIEEKEQIENNNRLEKEFITVLKEHIENMIDEGYAEMSAAGKPYATPLVLSIDEDALLKYFAENRLYTTVEALDADFTAEVKKIASDYENAYKSDSADAYIVTVNTIDYETQYSFHTDSIATDKDYVHTDFTSDVGNIVLVTYKNGDDVVQFILNYNIYTVKVDLGNGNVYELDKYKYVRIG